MDKKVLLVADDDAMNRMIIRKFLKDEYMVIEAVDGKDTMNKLHSTHVDALLLDIIMPEMDGLEVLEAKAKERELDHVGVLVATSTKEKTEREALSRGADDIVAKPYDPVVIKKRLSNILAVKTVQMRQELLLHNDTASFVNHKHMEVSQEVEAGMKKIDKFADIIRANKSNYKLVDEIVDEIQLETHQILDVLTKED